MKKLIAVLVVVGAVVLISLLIRQWATKTTLVLVGDQLPADTLVRNLSSSDKDLVMSSLDLLGQRRDPAGEAQARTLLSSSDDYIWFNAALYLGNISDQQAVPYLIKGLKHPASRAYPDVVRELQAMTNQTFGMDQAKWIAWWQATHDKTFSFRYPSLDKQSAEIHTGSMIAINGVIDSLTISYMGSPISLVGLRMKSGADPVAAQRALETATLGQFVEIERDGSERTANGAVPALVKWIPDTINPPDVANSLRTGLPPVPFTQTSSVDQYLLNSGYYEIDPGGVQDPSLRAELQAMLPAAQRATAPR